MISSALLNITSSGIFTSYSSNSSDIKGVWGGVPYRLEIQTKSLPTFSSDKTLLFYPPHFVLVTQLIRSYTVNGTHQNEQHYKHSI